VLAYISWHGPAHGVDRAAYEQALLLLHRSLAHRPPSGFRGSAAFRCEALPWLAPGRGADRAEADYEDWYLLDGWSALGVLEESVVARGHVTRHDALAGMAGVTSGAVYRLGEGQPRVEHARVGVWITRAPGHASVTIGDLLGDGMDRERSGLWRRCLGLGPAPEYCLLAPEVPAGVAATRLPEGWRAEVGRRELLFSG